MRPLYFGLVAGFLLGYFLWGWPQTSGQVVIQ
jgi:hypothetical protein